jgi:hypothetical protein
MTGTTRSLLQGPRSLNSRNILLVFDSYTMLLKWSRSHRKGFTSLRLVLYLFDYFNYSLGSTSTRWLHRLINIQWLLGHTWVRGLAPPTAMFYDTHLTPWLEGSMGQGTQRASRDSFHASTLDVLKLFDNT